MKRAALALTLLAACEDGGSRFVSPPEVPPALQTLVFGYVGSSEVQAWVPEDREAPVQLLGAEEPSDALQVLAYSQPAAWLGLAPGPLAPPVGPCERRCELLEPTVWTSGFTEDGWSAWSAGAPAPALLERLLPTDHRAPCQACRAFEVRHIELPHDLPASFVVPEPESMSALIGLSSGLILRMDSSGALEELCALSPEPRRAAARVEPGRLLLGEGGGLLLEVEPASGCAVLSSTQSASRARITRLAVHPETGAYYVLGSGGWLERFTPASGFERLARLPDSSNPEFAGIAFDESGAVFAVNGSTHYAYGDTSVEVRAFDVQGPTSPGPPYLRGAIHHAPTRQVIVAVEDHGLFGFREGRFELLAAEVNELGGLSPYGSGVVVGLRGGVVGQFSPAVGLCREINAGARRTPRWVTTLGARVLVGDPFVRRTDDGEGFVYATLLTPTDGCWLDEAR